jgi:hypothetical protein
MNRQNIKLANGKEVEIDWDSKSSCRKCNESIWWARTKKDKNMPVDRVSPGLYGCHFESCRFADEFRK